MYTYIHIPFCESKCKYCRFASFSNVERVKIKKYISYLNNDIKNRYNSKKMKTLYFWWWTPSILSKQELEWLIGNFKFADNYELTLESTPRNISTNSLKEWHELWINRISIWVQSLNNDTLKEIWRYSKNDVISALECIKKYSYIQNISVDFIIGLPFVKKWEVKSDIEYLLNRFDFIKHISVYMLEDYYYPESWSGNSIDDKHYLDEYSSVFEFLLSRWFNRYELSNFAKKWYECIHNMAYWDHSEVVAFWLWASGFENNVRYKYPDNFRDYYLWKIELDKLTRDDLITEKMMFWLRTSWIDNYLFKYLNNAKIDELISLNFLEKNKKLKPTLKWTLVLDYILRELTLSA